MYSPLLSLLIFPLVLIAQTPCENGFAGSYPCKDYDLMSEISVQDLSPTASLANDSWGWTDPDTGNEYAIVCLSNGTAFIDVTDAVNPIHLGNLPTRTLPSDWRDVKVYNNHAFIVSEAFNHGMQVFDLTRLRDVPAITPTTYNSDAVYTGFGSAHNIVINEDSGFAYAVGTGTFNGGPHFIDITNPLSPVAAGGFAMDDYSHDAQVVIYNGPDTEHRGKEILIGSNESIISIVDITDKANPVRLATTNYTQIGYTHQGWFTKDQRYFILGDELDEQDFGFPTRTLVYDLYDLDNPVLQFTYQGPTNAIDHNGYIVGDKFYLANYRAGFREIDLLTINAEHPTADDFFMLENAFFDTYPQNDDASFNGAWNVYPFFESGNILISDIDRGFFLVRPSEQTLSNEEQVFNNEFRITYTETSLIQIDYNQPIHKIEIFNTLGQLVDTHVGSFNHTQRVNLHALSSGVYLLKVNDRAIKKIIRR